MATGRDIVEKSMRLIGVLATGESAQASEAVDGLDSLNDMLDSWSNDNLIINAVTRETLTLTASQQSYTIGSGGDLNTTRPLDIVKALIQDAGGDETPMRLLTAKEFAEIGLKTTESTIPTMLYKEGTYPLETVKLYPVPSSATTLVLYTLKPLTTFTGLSTAASFPPGYLRALQYNLAVEIAPEFGVEASPTVMEIAAESLASIKRQNSKPQLLKCDAAVVAANAPWDWRTGES